MSRYSVTLEMANVKLESSRRDELTGELIYEITTRDWQAVNAYIAQVEAERDALKLGFLEAKTNFLLMEDDRDRLYEELQKLLPANEVPK